MYFAMEEEHSDFKQGENNFGNRKQKASLKDKGLQNGLKRRGNEARAWTWTAHNRDWRSAVITRNEGR
jgi:hypothetical protein